MRLNKSVISPAVVQVALLVAGLVCASCGGGGSSSANSFAGNYAGEFVDADNRVGAFNVTVAASRGSGNVSGQYVYSISNQTFNFTGTIGPDGVGTITTGNSQSGRISFGATNNQTTTLSLDNPNLPGAIAVLVKNPDTNINPYSIVAGTSPFIGFYAGSITDTTQNKTGLLALVVNSSGTISGIEAVNVHGTATATPITGTTAVTPGIPPNGILPAGFIADGTLTYKIGSNGVVVSGTTLRALASFTGTMSESNGDTATLALTSFQDMVADVTTAKR